MDKMKIGTKIADMKLSGDREGACMCGCSIRKRNILKLN